MRKILFISAIPSVHIDRWYRFFSRLKEFDTKLVICRDHMRNTFLSKILFVFTARKKIVRIIQEYNPDIINLHTLFLPNYLLYKYINCKTIITPWNGDIVWHKYPKEHLLIKWSKKLSKLTTKNIS